MRFAAAGPQDGIPLINPQRGIFKPQQMRFVLSIKTVFPKPGGKVWYDDQREVHRQEIVERHHLGQPHVTEPLFRIDADELCGDPHTLT